ncbi:hypothetical protein R1sor_017883 [Riccia sorocarpa]|uniref:Peptidase A2 domain-containing protein n=1 Tax=Riccia sorocarpa TaxID=122646 RepID=A0ABD3I8K3_9MARC
MKRVVLALVAAVAIAVPPMEPDVFATQVESFCGPSLLDSAIENTQPRLEELRREAERIRRTTGWADPVDSATARAFLAKTKRVSWSDVIVEEKRRRDEANLELDEPHMTRRRAAEVAKNGLPSTPPPASGPMEGVQGEIPIAEKGKPLRSALKEKGKMPSYKLAADIETSTNLKGMLDHVMDAKIEFTLRDLLRIAKREFHDLIIDIIKRKRQTVSEPAATQLVEVMDLAAEDDDAVKDIVQEEDDEVYHHLAFVTPSVFDLDDNEGEDGRGIDSDYRKEHWARATAEVQVKLEGLEEAVTALVDNGSEINIMSKELYDRGQWPIDLNHKWMIRGANNLKGALYGACSEVPVKVGDVIVNQHLFVQTAASYSVLLGMPYITAVRMETKVMDDGSHYARIRSLDDRRSVQFLAVHNIPSVKMKEFVNTLDTSLVSVSLDTVSQFTRLGDLCRRGRTQVQKRVQEMKSARVLADDEEVLGIFEEVVCSVSCKEWLDMLSSRVEQLEDKEIVPLPSQEVYEEIASVLQFVAHPRLEDPKHSIDCWCGIPEEAEVHTKYKSVMKKVKPMAVQLPHDSQHQMELVATEPVLRDMKNVGHKFTPKTLQQLQIGGGDFLTESEKKIFEDIILNHGKAFAFSPEEIGCVDPKVIAPMVIFIVPHVPWDLKPIPVLRALLPICRMPCIRFGVLEILVVDHLCGSFERKPNPEKVNAIARLADCSSITEVRRFLGWCIFYRLSVPHYAHIAEPLYALLKKGRRFVWTTEHHEAMEQLKEVLQSPPVLRRFDYTCGRSIILTVDTSPRAIANCTTPDIHMLRYIAYIRSLNPELQHIAGKRNVVADMLSMARYINEEEMLVVAEHEEEDDVWCRVGQQEVESYDLFKEELYGGLFGDIGYYLSTLTRRETWSDADFRRIRQKAYRYFLHDGYLWKRPKRRDGEPVRVIDDQETKLEVLMEYHESLWAGHRGIWATYTKIKERYW